MTKCKTSNYSSLKNGRLSLFLAVVFFIGAVSYRSCGVWSDRPLEVETAHSHTPTHLPSANDVVVSTDTIALELAPRPWNQPPSSDGLEGVELEGLVFSKNNVSMAAVLNAAGTGHISDLVSENGELNPRTLAEIGLNEGEIEVVDQARQELWDRMIAAAREYTTLDVLRAKGTDKHKQYVMAIPANIGEQGLRDFEHEIIRNLERDKAAQILQRLNWSHFFGKFGRSEVLFRLDREPQPTAAGMIKWTQINPKTGSHGSGGYFDMKSFHFKFGVLPPEVEP